MKLSIKKTLLVVLHILTPLLLGYGDVIWISDFHPHHISTWTHICPTFLAGMILLTYCQQSNVKNTIKFSTQIGFGLTLCCKFFVAASLFQPYLNIPIIIGVILAYAPLVDILNKLRD